MMHDAGSTSAAVVPTQRPTRARNRARGISRAGHTCQRITQGGEPFVRCSERSGEDGAPLAPSHILFTPPRRSGTQGNASTASTAAWRRAEPRAEAPLRGASTGARCDGRGDGKQFIERASSENARKSSSNTTFARLAGRGGVSRGVSVTPRGFAGHGVLGSVNPRVVRGFGRSHASGDGCAGDRVSPRGAAPPAPRGPPGGVR